MGGDPVPRPRALLALSLLFLLLGSSALRAEVPLRIGDPAPAEALRALRDLGGQPVVLPAGRVVIVDFFATWCGPCHLALAALERLVRDAGAPVSLVLVDVGEPPEKVRAFFAARALPVGARLALDPTGAAGRRFGQTRFPTTFLIDRGGVVRHINRGYGPGYEARLGRWLAGLLGAAP